MGEKYLVGIDSGTQSTRVIIYDTKGKRISRGSAQHPAFIAQKQGWAEHGKTDVWDALCAAAKEAFSEFDGDSADIIGIGVSSQRATLAVLDKDGNTMNNMINWMDGRWKENYRTLTPAPEGTDPWYARFLRYYSRANWLKNNEPEIYENACKYLTVAGFLSYKLTGDFVETISNDLNWPIDRENWQVSQEDWRFDLLGIRRDQMAEIKWPGNLIGNITPVAAAETGFPVGCPVYTAAGDKQLELLGAGAIEEGVAYITLGTLSALDIVSKDFKSAPDISFFTYLAAVPEFYHYEASIAKGFWLVSWFRDNLGADLKPEADKLGVSIEAMLDREGEKIPAGSEGLLAIPDWQAPGSRPYGKGMFIGFDDRHTRAHMYRALVESIAMQIKIGSDGMSAKVGKEIKELYIGGGGSKSKFIAQIIADIFGVPVTRTKESETCSLGAAMCAAVGTKTYGSFQEAVDNMSEKADVFQPIPENQELYTQLREKVVTKLYPAIEPVLKELVELTADK